MKEVKIKHHIIIILITSQKVLLISELMRSQFIIPLFLPLKSVTAISETIASVTAEEKVRKVLVWV